MSASDLLSSIRIPVDSSVISPLVIKALELLPNLYPYPSLLHLEVIGSTSAALRIHPLSWRLFPWLLNAFLLVGFLGLGSCAFVTFAPLLIQVSYTIPTFHRILIGMGMLVPLLHSGACLVIMRKPEIQHVVNSFVDFEGECET